MKLSHESFAFGVVKDRNNPRRKKTSLIKLATMIDVSAKDHRFCNHLNTSLPSRDSWPPRHEFIILYSAFLWVMRESIRSYLHSTKTSTITSSSSTLCNDQSRFIQRRVMVGDDSLMSTRRPSVQSVPRTNTKKILPISILSGCSRVEKINVFWDKQHLMLTFLQIHP